ncbi:uncharacterized protein LOC141853685 [Brevipalpus obovatus]|uniref:uncharacterized protein LOC141853685 n=1 Tax=Brevipalpus obovatus TaxID=246614 RepID=UPI003D9DBDF7
MESVESGVDSSVGVVCSSTVMESKTAHDLMKTLQILDIKPSSNVSVSELLSLMKEKIGQRLEKTNLSHEQPLLVPTGTVLSPQVWSSLDKADKLFYNDYKLRRQTLIARCDCTIQSFKWKEGEKSDLIKKIDERYNQLKSSLNPEPNVNMAVALATRESGCFDLLNSVVSSTHQVCDIEAPKTKGMANAGKQQRIELQKYLIGEVPDRGGRPDEQPAPAKETFIQQKDSRDGRGRGGRGGGGRGGHSDRGGYRNQKGEHHHQSQPRHHGNDYQNSYKERGGDRQGQSFHQFQNQNRGGGGGGSGGYDQYPPQQYSEMGHHYGGGYDQDDRQNAFPPNRGGRGGYQNYHHRQHNSYRGRSHY